MPKRKSLKDLSGKKLNNQAKKFIVEDDDVVFSKRKKGWKPEPHPDQK